MNTPDKTANPSAAANAGHARGPATVLLAEDDAALRRYLETVLRRAGYGVLAAADGLEAVRLALSAGHEVAAVVTDAVMPRLGGEELCRLLRSRPELKHLPVIILSGLDRREPAPAGPARPDAYLSKPVRAAELTDCLARLLEQTEAEDTRVA